MLFLVFGKGEWIRSGDCYTIKVAHKDDAKIYYCDTWRGWNDKSLAIFLKVSITGVIFSQSASCSWKLFLTISNDTSRNLFRSLNICILYSSSLS